MIMIDRFYETKVGKREGGVSSYVLPLTSDDCLKRGRNDWRQDV